MDKGEAMVTTSDVAPYTHIVGRAGRDAERVVGTNRVKFTVAVEIGFDRSTLTSVTEWYDVTAWDSLADALHDGKRPLIHKGDRVWIMGKASVWASTGGPRKQIAAREVGIVDRFLVALSPSITYSTVDATPAEEAELDGIGEW